jgi:hypothetical protein
MKPVQTVEARFDKIVEVYSSIPMDGSISMLTGSNGSGKSLIRQQLNFREELKKTGKRVAHCSMSLRTGLGGGGFAAFTHDTEWDPTSVNTINFIKVVSRSIHGGYMVLDEIEVGCSEETLMGIVAWANDNIREAIKGTLGCMVITHSPYVVRNFKFDHWFNLDGYDTPEAWLSREIVPVDLEKLRKDSNDLFRFVTAQKTGKK